MIFTERIPIGINELFDNKSNVCLLITNKQKFDRKIKKQKENDYHAFDCCYTFYVYSQNEVQL